MLGNFDLEFTLVKPCSGGVELDGAKTNHSALTPEPKI